MFYSCSVSVLLSEAPTAAFTTLLTQCTPYLHPIPTVLSTTFTVHSPPHPIEVPNFHPNFHTRFNPEVKLCNPPSAGSFTRFWRYKIYDISKGYLPSPPHEQRRFAHDLCPGCWADACLPLSGTSWSLPRPHWAVP